MNNEEKRLLGTLLNKRQFLVGAGSAAVGLGLGPGLSAQRSPGSWDLIVVGGGTAGLPAAIFAARRGAKVLLVEASSRLGGTLLLAMGQMSAAGTKVQKSKGIEDTPQEHFDDIIRISKNTVDRELVELAVWNAADTYDWLWDNDFEMVPEHPVAGRAHEPYSKLRYYWGTNWGVSIVTVLKQQIQPEIDSGNVTVAYGTQVKELVQQSDGTVTGVVTESDDGTVARYDGRRVLLACGGYAANHDFFRQVSGYTHYADMSYPFSQGAGHRMGVAAGGYLRGRENYLCNFGGVMADANVPSKLDVRLNSYPERRQPWEIYVNANGRRFVREDIPSVDAREHALLDQPDLRYWAVFDEAIRRQSPPLVDGWTPAELLAMFDDHPNFHRADSLEALAAQAGLDANNLVRTVARYNQGVATGHDLFGREHKPLPVSQGPFYAIRVQGYSVTSTVGLAVDPDLRVVREGGDPIPNLYAAGELLAHVWALAGRAHAPVRHMRRPQI
jgi:fumarate reductase flavoprotein subunit